MAIKIIFSEAQFQYLSDHEVMKHRVKTGMDPVLEVHGSHFEQPFPEQLTCGQSWEDCFPHVAGEGMEATWGD